MWLITTEKSTFLWNKIAKDDPFEIISQFRLRMLTTRLKKKLIKAALRKKEENLIKLSLLDEEDDDGVHTGKSLFFSLFFLRKA